MTYMLVLASGLAVGTPVYSAVSHTKVTRQGFDKLREALPNCKVFY